MNRRLNQVGPLAHGNEASRERHELEVRLLRSRGMQLQQRFLVAPGMRLRAIVNGEEVWLEPGNEARREYLPAGELQRLVSIGRVIECFSEDDGPRAA